MACLYQVHQSEIYSVKWYRGTQEFYRYSPLESPTTRVTPVNGIKVDVSKERKRFYLPLLKLPRHTLVMTLE